MCNRDLSRIWNAWTLWRGLSSGVAPLSICDPLHHGFCICLQWAHCLIAFAWSLPLKKWPHCVTADGQKLWDRLLASSVAKYISLYCILLLSVYVFYFLLRVYFSWDFLPILTDRKNTVFWFFFFFSVSVYFLVIFYYI